jgi:hypothetical protein
MSIPLHPKLGVNPRLTVCRRCGGNTNELVLLGNRNKVMKCTSCNALNYGSRASDKCSACSQRSLELDHELSDAERVPAMAPCDACAKELDEHAAVVADGGIYFRCADCRASGVIKKSPFADAVRAAHGLEAPAPCGVEFTKADCPKCRSQ